MPSHTHTSSSFVQPQPQHHHGQHVHGHNHAAHQRHILVEVLLFVDQHFGEENARIRKVAVHQRRRVRTHQIRPIHAVCRVDDAMKGGPKVADVPHPAEQRRDVDQTRTEAKHREQNSQNRTDENGQLKNSEQVVCVSCAVPEYFW